MSLPRYDAGSLPEGEWHEYRKTTITRAVQMDHDFEVVTIDGNAVKGKAGDYILVDSHGFPYPCNRFEFPVIYTEVISDKPEVA